MIHYFFPVLATLSVSTLIGLIFGGFIRTKPDAPTDECARMAKLAEQTIAKEELWIPELRQRIKDRTELIDKLNYDQRNDQYALNTLVARKWKDEADQ